MELLLAKLPGGINAVIMDEVELGDECIVCALSFIKQGEKFPARSLIAENPAKIIKQVSESRKMARNAAII
jgi:phenylacetic acid degradation protein/carnitine operon protein CaiE